MAAVELITDTGPLVAFFNRGDQYHSWAKEQFDRIFSPLITCEAVLSEVIFYYMMTVFPWSHSFKQSIGVN
jgi:predicted nucleic acid-binding protein